MSYEVEIYLDLYDKYDSNSEDPIQDEIGDKLETLWDSMTDIEHILIREELRLKYAIKHNPMYRNDNNDAI